MARSFSSTLRYLDWPLITAVLILLSIGLAVLFSLGNNSTEGLSNFTKQIVFVIIGFAIAIFLAKIDFRTVKSYTYIFIGISLVLLVLVLLFGVRIRNTTGWFSFGVINLQPVEFVKVLWILSFGGYLASRGTTIRSWRNLLLPGFVFVVLFGLVMLQPDLGSALILCAITLGMFVVSPVRTRQIVIVISLCVVLLVVSWFGILREYQKERIRVLFSPSRDPLGRGYHVSQSIIAVGSGGWFGKGLGFGSQSQLKFLPEQQSDFIFAVIAEDLGFVGSGLVLLLCFFILYRGIRIGWASRDVFGSLLAYGIVIMLFTHMFINIGMNIGLFPVAGIPLPFVSYGGSSLLTVFASLGLLQSIGVTNKLGTTPA